MTKWGFEIDKEAIKADINRLTNQIWKLIPMRENEENWKNQLDTVTIEIAGLNEIFDFGEEYVILLSKLQGLRIITTEFDVYRKIVFECISLLRSISYD